MRSLACFLVLGLAFCWAATPLPAQEKAALTSNLERTALHNSPDWALIAPHLPDPATASAAQLETMGDVLRARRFPEDALDYYGYAIARGGDLSELLNKMGIVRLELHQTDLAHELFLRSVRTRKANSGAWNNLGVSDYANGNYRRAVHEYKHACKLNQHSAIFHSNLGLAYFERGDLDAARLELLNAIRIDPDIMTERDTGGATAHLLGSRNYSGFCLEMADLYARVHDVPQMLLWLGKASDAGMNLRDALHRSAAVATYAKDPRMILLMQNEGELHGHSIASTKAPGLGSSPQP